MAKKLKTFDVTTKQSGEFHFFTSASNGKVALKNMINRSSDFKNIVKGDKDFTVSIKCVD